MPVRFAVAVERLPLRAGGAVQRGVALPGPRTYGGDRVIEVEVRRPGAPRELDPQLELLGAALEELVDASRGTVVAEQQPRRRERAERLDARKDQRQVEVRRRRGRPYQVRLGT